MQKFAAASQVSTDPHRKGGPQDRLGTEPSTSSSEKNCRQVGILTMDEALGELVERERSAWARRRPGQDVWARCRSAHRDLILALMALRSAFRRCWTMLRSNLEKAPVAWKRSLPVGVVYRGAANRDSDRHRRFRDPGCSFKSSSSSVRASSTTGSSCRRFSFTSHLESNRQSC